MLNEVTQPTFKETLDKFLFFLFSELQAPGTKEMVLVPRLLAWRSESRSSSEQGRSGAAWALPTWLQLWSPFAAAGWAPWRGKKRSLVFLPPQVGAGALALFSDFTN